MPVPRGHEGHGQGRRLNTTRPLRQRVPFVAAAVGLVAAGSSVIGPGTIGLRSAGAASPPRAATTAAPGGIDGHEASEGFRLAAAAGESVARGSACDSAAPVESFAVAAINVDITLNRYLDHDPRGRMYVLEEDLARVRAEEAANAAARAGRGEPAVSPGLQGDAIQPLTLRVNQGTCLQIRLRDALANGEPASLHLHGSTLHVLGTQHPAVAHDPRAMARPDRAVTYEWMVGAREPEGVHYFHSHGDDRTQTSHGLFGALIVEPQGSDHIDPLTGQRVRSGWQAIIRPRRATAFREFTLYYHEVGNEAYQVTDRAGRFTPLVDPLLGEYRPGSRALNYRSEPFMNRLALQQSKTGRFDESLAYSSYTFGDPATPVMRSYVGEPVKQRLVHGGSEVFHVHHLHGGAIRWRRQPGVATNQSARGLDKHPPLLPGRTERVDSQALGPSETFDAEDECGSGGCQQSVGDFLFHCHVAQHYFAGMWGIWRVYNTLQNGLVSTDALPPLPAIPSSVSPAAAVTSDSLVGTTVDFHGQRARLATPAAVDGFVSRQLPPPGVPRGYDASVLDWTRDGNQAVNERETTDSWPGYTSRTPGLRPALLFDPRSGKPAYPFLRPHLSKRPPFAPNHGPAPYLDPSDPGADPPAPGANGEASVCPAGTRPRQFAINAITLPVPLNTRANIVDPIGEIYVLRDQEDAIRANPSLRRPLAIRTNASQDCVDVLFRNELEDNVLNHGFAKANVHIHFVQFDVQASDGVITGFNYEQSARPYAVEGERIRSATAAGATSISVSSTARFQPGIDLGVGMERDREFEIRRVVAVLGTTLTFDRALEHVHAAGETVSTEFLRYRWYPDVQFGTAYFHDHVNALESWRHGLFGALIAEPPDSTYHDPATGAEIASGFIADIHTDARVSTDVKGSFRELVMFIQDDNPLTSIGRSTGSSLNLRAEPLVERGRDPTAVFSTSVRGDPETAVLNAYLGDPVVVRTLVAGTNDVHSWHLDGHWFRAEPHSTTSPPINTINVGISERFDLSIARAGGPQLRPGDYLFSSGRSFKLREGSWGLLRVKGAADPGLRPLPGHETVPAATAPDCPTSAPNRTFRVSAIDAPLPMLGGQPGKVYVPDDHAAAVASGKEAAQPMVLHATVGDCLVFDLTNRTRSPVSLHADLLAFDPNSSGGIAAGTDPPQAVSTGNTRRYVFFASPEVGVTTAMLRDGADPTSPGIGLYGAVVVAPTGSHFTDPTTGRDVGTQSTWRVDVHPPAGHPYRDFALFLQDEDPGIGTHRMPYAERVAGTVGINYRVADSDRGPSTDPPPRLEAFAGDPVRVHVLVPWSEQAQVFSIEGHRWPLEPGEPGSSLVSSTAVAGLDVTTLDLAGGAGSGADLAGDYEYGNHRTPYRDAGMWGIFRVHTCDDSVAGLRHLDTGCRTAPQLATGPVMAGAGVALLALAGVRRRRRSP